MRLSRRNLFETLGSLGVASALGSLWPTRAHAAPPSDRSFLFVEFNGGWDITLSLDPRDPAQFPDSAKHQTRIELAWDRLPPSYGRQLVPGSGGVMQFGPAIGALAQQANQMCLVRGMSMETLTHLVGSRYFITGKQPAGLNARGSSVGSELVDQTLAAGGTLSETIPHLVLDTESFYVGPNEQGRPFRAGSANPYQLVFAFRRGLSGGLEDVAQGLTADIAASFRASATVCDPAGLSATGAYQRYRNGQQRVNDLLAAGVGERFDVQAPTVENFLLNQRYGSATLGTPGCAAAIAYQALKYGVSRFVTVRLQSDLDTHTASWAVDQPRLQREAFDALNTLLVDLQTTDDARRGGKLLDHTTVVVFSEFSRTAMLNIAGGRDHALTNACMLFGAGVPKNRVVGASSDVGMQPQPIDPVTGLPSTAPNAVVLRPEHVLASVMQSAGYSSDVVRQSGLPCLMA